MTGDRLLSDRVSEVLRSRDLTAITWPPDAAEPSAEPPTVPPADVLVHAGGGSTVRTALSAATAAGVQHVVVTSSAAVYGAWRENPVPLTEDSAVRPNPGFAFAAEQAEGERALAEWLAERPSVRGAVLRLAPVVAPTGDTWLSATVSHPSLLRTADDLAPVQVMHLDDAVGAIVHTVERRLAGTFNAAPIGWVSGDVARALSAAGVPVPLPVAAARIVERLAWWLSLGGAPPGAAPYREQPWVIASDRLRVTGWMPAYSTEEALVACRPGSWWRELSPDRRQQVALSVAGVVMAGVAAAAWALVRRFRRRL